MKIRIHSDLHHEFYRDRDIPFIEDMDLDDVDVLILAGDILQAKGSLEVLDLYALKGIPIVFVPGNHEYYGGYLAKIDDKFRRFSAKHKNFHVLNNDVVEISGQRFLGTTLWYPAVSPLVLNQFGWSDFRYIKGAPTREIFKRAATARRFLEENLEPGDVVVSHMLPSWRSVHSKYTNADTNCFFVHNCEDLIIERKPRLWVHGHTHETCDYQLADTRVVANPRGYPNHGMWPLSQYYENVFYEEEKIVEI